MSGSRLLVFGGCTGERFLNTMFAIEVPEMLSKTLMLKNAKPLSAVKSSPRLDSVEGELDSALSGLRKEVLGSSAGTVGSIVDENMRLRKENEMLREAVASLTQRLAMLATVDREYL
jgi:hypothetical protein